MPRSILRRLFGRAEGYWCCLGFQANYENAGHRGFAVLVGRDLSSGPRFLIQHRAVESEDEAAVKSEKPLSLVSQTGLASCPWCGENLAERYGDRADELFREGSEIAY